MEIGGEGVMDVRKMETTEPDAEDGQHWRQYIYIAITYLFAL